MTRIIKILLNLGMIFCLVAALFCIDATHENIDANRQIRDYISRGEFLKEEYGIRFYTVESEYELHSPVLNETRGRYNLGSKGDIYCMQESLLNIVPFSQELVTYFIGGHAGILYDEYSIVETTGMDSIKENNRVVVNYNNILYSSDERSVVGLRAKGSIEDASKAAEYAYDQLHKPYNYTFIFNRKSSYYCTDLVSRSYGKEAGLNYKLDNDGIAVSIHDLIVSDDTFIIYYKYVVDGITHLYYSV